jgi:hypothetical protein
MRDKLLKLLSSSAPKGFCFSGVDVLDLKRPALYVWLRGDTILYVGIGRMGARRIFSVHHRLNDVLPGDQIILWPMESLADAKEAEAIILESTRPRFNKRGRYGVRAVAKLLGISEGRARCYTA